MLVAAALTFAGGFAVAQDDPHQSAQNSDTSLPNSPWKARGIPDSGEFNPTGPRYETPRPPPPPPPPVAPPPPPPPPAVAPPPPPPPPPAPPPPPPPPRPDRG
ncbi:hypothetical protein C6570_07680 [Ottowia oryzae]|uniref:Uncharacterized protein n=1 Tax=Ottowia oryzae TaxID=2109914 RepID=A0A2S0ME86_9BURK|nr:hypothetical protein C6570_07680 [Ottowia oryzae]